jgi:hypothetical protein
MRSLLISLLEAARPTQEKMLRRLIGNSNPNVTVHVMPADWVESRLHRRRRVIRFGRVGY